MNPRLESSKKWTPLPPELCSQICDVFASAFEERAKTGKFVVEGRIYPKELLFRVGFLESGRLRQENVEISLDFDPNKQNALEMIHFLVDCAASMMQEIFDSEEGLDAFPHEWKSISVDKREVFIQVSSINSNLEAEADRLLGENSDDLVQGEDEEELKQTAVSMLGLGGTDEDESDEAMLEKVKETVRNRQNKKSVH